MASRIDHRDLEERAAARLTRGPAEGGELRLLLEVSQPTLSRLMARMNDRVVRLGSTKKARYALRRTIDDVVAPLPLYEINEQGESRVLGTLHAVEPDPAFVFESGAEGVGPSFTADLPYFLQDMRPRGYLGRQLIARRAEVGAPRDINHWTSNHTVRYLARFGWDHVGNLILGEDALLLYLQKLNQGPEIITRRSRKSRYEKLANEDLALGEPGSSAAGEQPKFLAVRAEPEPTPVLVKFSPPVATKVGRRVADLLIAEHLAMKTLGDFGVVAASTELVFGKERTFLEVTRFDRTAGGGRRGVVSLEALDAQYIGDFEKWSTAASKLAREGILQAAAAEHLRRVELFGELIANTDMHQGNFSFFTQGLKVLGPAPVYDMGPALFAPHRNQIVERVFTPKTPAPRDAAYWLSTWKAAMSFWEACASDERISRPFRSIAKSAKQSLSKLEYIGQRLPK